MPHARWAAVIIIILMLFIFLGWGSLNLAQASPAAEGFLKPTPPAEDTIGDIEQAIKVGMSFRADFQPVYAIAQHEVSNIRVSSDESWATAWLNTVDPQTGEAIPADPGLVLLQKQGDAWITAFPGDNLWQEWLSAAPAEAMPADEKAYWLLINQESQAAVPAAAQSGYLLPWPNGLTRKLSGSVRHDEYIPSGSSHYAFDFYLSGQMWNIHASKAGTVARWKDDIENNSTEAPGNYIVIKDSATTYQLYLHLAQDSIPNELKVVGAPVQQGQFIGIADDTGASTGHHLHFMVHTSPSSYWGTSVDITFADVAINGGRPRIHRTDIPGYDDQPYCWPNDNFPTKPKDECSQFQESYVSGNVYYIDTIPPSGGLTAPVFGTNIATQTVTVNGWGVDAGVGLKNAQIRAYLNGAWTDIGPALTTSPFSYSWNLCSANVPDGPVSLSLRLVDNVNNAITYNSLVTFLKNYNCPLPTPAPPAACSPSSNQVALFSGDNFRGDCVIKDVGNYAAGSDLSPVGDDRAISIRVGANVQATLFTDSAFGGRSETLRQDDSSLADNLVRASQASSMIVQLRTVVPNPPQPLWPEAGGTFTQTQSLSLTWRDQGGGSEFQARLTRASTTITSTWLTEPFWHLGTGVGSFLLDQGSYSWQVRARNSAGTSGWSSVRSLTIAPKTVSSPAPIQAPFTDPMESIGGWSASGLWHHESAKPAASPTHTWWFGTCKASGVGCDEYYYNGKTGDLTSPPIQLPGSGSYFLRFQYRYQTETSGKFWDQRWVQVSVNGGPFTNVYQLSDDIMLFENSPFHSSPPINLSAYAGQTIQIRFHFDTMDVSAQTAGGDNDFEGWYIDDVSVTDTPPAVCVNPDLGGNTASQAYGLPLNATIAEAICPEGDLDYFRFTAAANTWVTANIGRANGSSLDSVLQLIGEDGSSILAENDDERYPDILDSLIRFYIPRSGNYYIKVKGWGHPGEGGVNFAYNTGVYQDAVDPLADLVFPTSSTLISQTIQLKAQVSDLLSGVDRVEFYFHDYQWANPAWRLLGQGTLDQGYWVLPFNPAAEAVQFNAAFLILAYDRAGNVTADALWFAKLAKSIFYLNLPAVQDLSP
jgi:murein DD-endopeptidase MepM/ murein hydrolase activator NlpD